jgi:hypothetical protein
MAPLMSLELTKNFLNRALRGRQMRGYGKQVRLRLSNATCLPFLEKMSAFKLWTLTTFPTAFFCYSQIAALCTTHR